VFAGLHEREQDRRAVAAASLPQKSQFFRLCKASHSHSRKNHYGSRSERGTRVAALFYTLIESAKLAGVEPAAYLAEATRRAIANAGTVTLPKDLAGG
jgi:hypothetical protein